MSRLSFYFERYGNELEADFQEVWRLNLGELVRSVQVRRISNLVNQLPSASRFAAAVANDPEHVEMILEATEGQPEEEPTRSLAEWSPQVELLSEIADLLKTQIGVAVAAAGGKPSKMPNTPRPLTAFNDVRAARRRTAHQSLVSRLLPRKVE